MVIFKLKLKGKDNLIYEYFPNGCKDEKCGIIKLDTKNRKISIVSVAKRDFKEIITARELKDCRDWINKCRKEEGKTSLTEEELPTLKKDVFRYYFGTHALNAIWDDFINDNLREEGMVVWG